VVKKIVCPGAEKNDEKFNFNLIIKKRNFLYFDYNNKKKLQNYLKKI